MKYKVNELEGDAMKRGDRVTLISDHRDAQGLSFAAGQCGTFLRMLDGLAVVEFDGYEAEKQRAEEFQRDFGESPNVVPWHGLVAVEKLAPVSDALQP